MITYNPGKYQIEDVEYANYSDVDSKIISIMIKMLDEAEFKGHLINWFDFKKYCMEFFILPESCTDRCIEKAKKLTKYKLGNKRGVNDEFIKV